MHLLTKTFALCLFFISLLSPSSYADVSMDLIGAARNGDTARVKVLLKQGANVNAIEEQSAGLAYLFGGSQTTPLIEASSKGHTEIVKLLLEANANVDKADAIGFTPLMLASWKGHLEVVRLLLDAKADVNRVDEDGFTALLLASSNNHREIVKLLKKYGAKE